MAVYRFKRNRHDSQPGPDGPIVNGGRAPAAAGLSVGVGSDLPASRMGGSVAPGELSPITLRWGRSRLLEWLWPQHRDRIAVIGAALRQQEPDPVLDGNEELLEGSARAIKELVEHGLRCVERGSPGVEGLPRAALLQVRLAAAAGVSVETLMCRYDLGSKLFWAWVAEQIACLGFSTDPSLSGELRFALLQQAWAIEGELLHRFHREVAIEHARASALVATAAKDRTGLTRVEQQVHRLVCNGYTNQQIAEELGVSVNTVRTHVSHILEKCGVRSRYELVEEPQSTAAGEVRVLRLSYARTAAVRPWGSPRHPAHCVWRSPARAPSRVPLAISRAA